MCVCVLFRTAPTTVCPCARLTIKRNKHGRYCSQLGACSDTVASWQSRGPRSWQAIVANYALVHAFIACSFAGSAAELQAFRDLSILPLLLFWSRNKILVLISPTGSQMPLQEVTCSIVSSCALSYLASCTCTVALRCCVFESADPGCFFMVATWKSEHRRSRYLHSTAVLVPLCRYRAPVCSDIEI